MSVQLAFDPLPLLVGASTVAAAGTYQQNQVDVTGFKYIRGYIFSSLAAAANFPRIRQSVDGQNWDVIDVIAQDVTQANFVYTIDVEIFGNYATVEYTDAGAGSTVRASVWAVIQ